MGPCPCPCRMRCARSAPHCVRCRAAARRPQLAGAIARSAVLGSFRPSHVLEFAMIKHRQPGT
eukprot:1711653-Prymnesium_polylepis.1